MGNFVMGLAACAKACIPCAVSSALLMDGCRGFDFNAACILHFITKPAVLWIGGLLQDGASVDQNSAGR